MTRERIFRPDSSKHKSKSTIFQQRPFASPKQLQVQRKLREEIQAKAQQPPQVESEDVKEVEVTNPQVPQDSAADKVVQQQPQQGTENKESEQNEEEQ